MALIVQKYGGTSARSPDGIKSVACKVAKFRAAGHQVVVSAMSGETSRLTALRKDVAANPTSTPQGVHRRRRRDKAFGLEATAA